MRTQLLDDEQTVLIIRKHIFYVFLPFVATIAIVFLYIYAHNIPKLANVPLITEGLQLAILVGILISLYRYINRKSDIWVVTNKRVIDEWGIVSHNFKELSFNNIQNLTYTQNLIGLIFGFGNIELQTSATDGNLIDTFIETPKKLKQAITEQKDKYFRAKEKNEAEISAKAISEAVANAMKNMQNVNHGN